MLINNQRNIKLSKGIIKTSLKKIYKQQAIIADESDSPW